MPLLRARELEEVITRRGSAWSLCDGRLAEELRLAEQRLAQLPDAPRPQTVLFGPEAGEGSLDSMLVDEARDFTNVDTAADDPCLIGFTSGTTGKPKGAVHFHRDVLAICDTFVAEVLKPSPDDVFAGSPPLAFTYGLGGLLIFPFWVGAVDSAHREGEPAGVAPNGPGRQSDDAVHFAHDVSRAAGPGASSSTCPRLKDCVSAGEPLPLPTYQAWERATGLKIIDGLGSTELLHIFITAAARPDRARRHRQGGAGLRGARGGRRRAAAAARRSRPAGGAGPNRLPLPGRRRASARLRPRRLELYRRRVQAGRAGLLLVPGARRRHDHLGRLQHRRASRSRTCCWTTRAVKECGVIGAPDAERGHIVKAFVVLREPNARQAEDLVRELQDFVKQEIAPYKYPRAIEFVTELPRTETGKLQRYRLRSRPA